ncbi:MAG: chromate transporter [Verrucomicrobia bacterium]|nr:chromate transporter [Verrucomicrobiota bacterium]
MNDSDSWTPAQRLRDVAGAFLKLGLTSFGGPVAHLGFFHAEIVRRRGWIDEAEYADLVALCQFLPGPASSQVVFALGQRRAGILGACVASLCFTLPSAILMIAFGYGVTAFAQLPAAGWIHGLKLAAVAVVAQAILVMGRKLCPDLPRIALALFATAAVLLIPLATTQVGVIGAGALFGWAWYRGKEAAAPTTAPANDRHLGAGAALASFGLLLIALPVAAKLTGNRDVQMFDSFYRAGSLVFGGGHVVLPLLRAEVVPPGWVADAQFLAGYGMAQAVPGPLFTFAGYLGTVIHGDPHAWSGGVLGLFAIFLPAWLLVGGALPFWNSLRSIAGVQAALRGANAAVVGVLLAAFYNPIWRQGIASVGDFATALGAFALLQTGRVPVWLIVVLAAVAGIWTVGPGP